MPLVVVQARRVHFTWSTLPREVANVWREPAWLERSGVPANDEGLGG